MNRIDVEKVLNAKEQYSFGSGTTLMLRAADTGREYALTYEQIMAAVDLAEAASDADGPAKSKKAQGSDD